MMDMHIKEFAEKHMEQLVIESSRIQRNLQTSIK